MGKPLTGYGKGDGRGGGDFYKSFSPAKRKSYPEIHLFSRFYYRCNLLYFNSNQYFQVLLNPDSTIPRQENDEVEKHGFKMIIVEKQSKLQQMQRFSNVYASIILKNRQTEWLFVQNMLHYGRKQD